jgi:hypothetical protein
LSGLNWSNLTEQNVTKKKQCVLRTTGRSETYLGKRVATAMNDPLGLGENIIKCRVNVTVVYLRY